MAVVDGIVGEIREICHYLLLGFCKGRPARHAKATKNGSAVRRSRDGRPVCVLMVSARVKGRKEQMRTFVFGALKLVHELLLPPDNIRDVSSQHYVYCIDDAHL